MLTQVMFCTFATSKCMFTTGEGLFIGEKLIFSVFAAGDWMFAAGEKTSAIGESLPVKSDYEQDHEQCNIYRPQPGFSLVPTNKKYLHTRVTIFPLYTCVLQYLLLL